MKRMDDAVVVIEGLGKRYALSHQHRPDSIKAWLRDIAHNTVAREKKPADQEFWALHDVSLSLRRGECLALIGRNGSGKSTLLKILSRVIPPSQGLARISGHVAALLEVGTGFHPELTGRENIFLNGAILGCPEKEIRRQFDAIVAFSDIETFLDTPVKHYSSGMYMRLAYSIAAHTDADIMIIDEVLAVGDTQFQQKCLSHVKGIIAAGRSAIVVSHHRSIIESVATHVAWLKNGQLVEAGPIRSDILQRYEDSN